MSVSDWITKNTHLKKKPFSFEGYEFQKQIADDMHQNLVCIKCSQVGMTEIQLRKFLAFLKRHNAVTGIFTLPDDNMYKRVSSTRAKPLISGEPVFNMHTESVIRRLDLYQIDQSFGYFTGNKESDATSIPADLKFHDELDLSDQEIISLFSSRLQNSDFMISQSFSTPTFVGYGVDALYQVSDQHEYLLRCTHCNHHNLPQFNLNYVTIPGLKRDLTNLEDLNEEMLTGVDLSKAYLRCEKCSHPLNRHDPGLRQWVPKYPGRQSRGYRILPFSTSRISLEYVIRELLNHRKKFTLRRFYNTVLAQPYDGADARLSEKMIRDAMKGPNVPEIAGPYFIGIDVGITCHVVVGSLAFGKPVCFLWKQVKADKLIEELEVLDAKYPFIAGVIDRHPETVLANSVREWSNQRIMPMEYRGTAALEFVKDELDKITHVQADRTGAIDTAADAVRKGRVEFAGYGQHGLLVTEHLQGMVRVEQDKDRPAVWNKLPGGNDHFFHALVYFFFAVRMKTALDFNKDEDERLVVMATKLSATKVPQNLELGTATRRKIQVALGVH